MKGGQISSFFAKKGVGKAKPVEEAAIAAAAAIHTTSLFSDLPGEYFGSQGWDEGVLEGESPLAASQRQGESTGLETALRSQLAVAVGELADDEGEDDEVMRKRIESEEARKKLEDAKVNTAKAALRRAQEVGGGGGGPLPPTPAAPAPSTGGGTFAEAMAAKRALAAAAEAAGGGSSSEKHVAVSGVKNDRILSEDTKAFPSLSGSAPTPAAAPAKKAGNPWAKINIADMPAQDVGAGVNGQATTTTTATSSSTAAAPTLASMALDALVYTGSQAALTTKAAVLEKSRFIIEELLGQGDSAEALRRFTEIRCTPVELRAHVATGIIDAGLDLATDMGKQMKVGKLLSLIVPARIVTRAQLISAVSSIMADYEILRVDFPKIDSQLGNMCSNGLVCGTLKEGAFASTGVGIPSHDAQGQRECGYVPVGYIALNIAKNIPGLKDMKSAGTLLPKEGEGEGGEEGGVGGGAPPSSDTAPAPAPAPAPAAGAKDDDEEGGGVKLAKKKKKAAVVEDDD